MYFKYEIQPALLQKPAVNHPYVLNLKSVIQKIHICDGKYLCDRGEISFVVESNSK